MKKKTPKKKRTAQQRWHAKLKNASSPLRLVGRKGTVQGAFWKALCPVEVTTADQISEHLAKFVWAELGPLCVYCGRLATDWDHLMPLREDPRGGDANTITFTGFGSLLSNLVPACASCNQSKGFTHWQAWLAGESDHAEFARAVDDKDALQARLVELEADAMLGAQQPTDTNKVTLWAEYNKVLREIQALLERADELAKSIRAEGSRTEI